MTAPEQQKKNLQLSKPNEMSDKEISYQLGSSIFNEEYITREKLYTNGMMLFPLVARRSIIRDIQTILLAKSGKETMDPIKRIEEVSERYSLLINTSRTEITRKQAVSSFLMTSISWQSSKEQRYSDLFRIFDHCQLTLHRYNTLFFKNKTVASVYPCLYKARQSFLFQWVSFFYNLLHLRRSLVYGYVAYV